MTDLELMAAKIAELEAENAALKNPPKKERTLTCKVSSKGAVSIYGLGKFPVTLYKGQWDKLIAFIPALQEFMVVNAGALSIKTKAEVSEDKAA